MGTSSDDENAPGSVRPARVIKAGCGIRFDPDDLEQSRGFDFSGAASLCPQSPGEEPEREGVVKYRLDFREQPGRTFEGFRELSAWRHILFRLGLIGQDPDRYGGLGFGNLSVRAGPDTRAFFITGTQTGGLPELDTAGYALVEACDPVANHIRAVGPVRPSSEALTHGAIYSARPECRFVFHVHCPAIWRQAAVLGLPATSEGTDYGTPAMAGELQRLVSGALGPDRGVVVMAGHRDGVLAYGDAAGDPGALLVATLARALAAET